MIGRWCAYLAVLLGALMFHIYYFGWVSWYLLLLILALPLLSLLISLPMMLRLRVRWRWQIAAKCTRGAPAVLRLGRRSGWIPTPRRCVTLQTVHLGAGQSRSQKLWLNRSSSVRLDTAHCGVLQCRLRRGWVYDALGLFRLPCRLPPMQELMIFPQREAVNPLPDLTPLSAVRWQPTVGGMAERHELRDYRPGDAMRSVHWKLSAKTDELIVREPQEPMRRTVLVTLDLQQDPAAMDRVMDRLNWMTDWLLQHEIPHEVRCLDSSGRMLRTPIQSPENAQTLIAELLHIPLTEPLPGLADRHFPEADWRFHISAD